MTYWGRVVTFHNLSTHLTGLVLGYAGRPSPSPALVPSPRSPRPHVKKFRNPGLPLRLPLLSVSLPTTGVLEGKSSFNRSPRNADHINGCQK
jgi:hypothetical protein